MTSRKWAVGFLLAMALACLPRGVSAADPRSKVLRPSAAQADIDAAMKERAFAFCSEPRKPLSSAARALCLHAANVPNCAGFAAACAPDGESSFIKFMRRLGRALRGVVPDFVKGLLRAVLRVPVVIFLLLVAGIVGAGIAVVTRSMTRLAREAPLREGAPRHGKSEANLSEILETRDAEALLSVAETHARRGDNDVALQLYLAASLRALDRRGAVRCAKHRTNGEYSRSCTEEPSRAPLREIIREADRAAFGRTPATPAVVSRAAELATGIVRWLPLGVLLIALPALAGCGDAGVRRAGDDPAGDELFHELLRRQGVRVEPLDGPLDSLAPPEPGGAAVVVDLETTPLDDEARSHLVDWVRGGGILVLVGAAEAWPPAFGAKAKGSSAHALWAWKRSEGPQSPVPLRAELAAPAAFEVDFRTSDAGANDEADDDDDARPERVDLIASFDVERAADGATYAAAWPAGRGLVLGIATDELLTNAALARPGNAAALVAILSHAGRSAFKIADPEDGAGTASSPVAALLRAGLGLALAHGMAAAVILFVAAGVRLGGPKPASPPRRRAFVEHVEAVGALYARAGAARHAVTAYARFAEQRLRARMPRGAVDVAAFLASRAHLPQDVCERVLKRAGVGASIESNASEKRSTFDDLMVLKELITAYAAATAHDD